MDEVDEEESRRVVKKRRTSSDLPEEARIVVRIPPGEVEHPVTHPKRSTTPEADPDGDQWDDLDAEDADDPLMVSEYVDEILTDWLIQVHSRFRLSFQKPFSSVSTLSVASFPLASSPSSSYNSLASRVCSSPPR